MRATANFCELKSLPCLRLLLAALALFVACPSTTIARDRSAEAEEAARKLTPDLEKERFEFRAEAWIRQLTPDIGKAVRMQLFKGNDYRFCIAVPRDSGVFITAAVLDLNGNPTGEIQPVLDGWGCILSFKPQKTGVYVIAVHQTDEGKHREVPCAIVTGYR